jgi:hypothetical protein
MTRASDGLRVYTRKDDGYMEHDCEYSHRAYLYMNYEGRDCIVMFPAAQYEPPEQKNIFINLLNKEMANWRGLGATIKKVCVKVGGKPAWEFDCN